MDKEDSNNKNEEKSVVKEDSMEKKLLDKYEELRKYNDLWEMAIEQQEYLNALELECNKLYEEGRKDGFRMAVTLVIEDKYSQNDEAWLLSLKMYQLKRVVEIVSVIKDFDIFHNVMGMLS